MAFSVGDILTPTSIGRIDHFLDDLDGGMPGKSLQFNLEVLDQFGDVMDVRSGDEQPHLTGGQISDFLAFMTNRRANIASDLGWDVGHTPGRMTWRFRDLDGTNPNRSLFLRVAEYDELAQFVQNHVIDDQPNLSGAQVTAAIALLDDQRVKAIAEIIP
jgi:hypothetical protein